MLKFKLLHVSPQGEREIGTYDTWREAMDQVPSRADVAGDKAASLYYIQTNTPHYVIVEVFVEED